MLDGEIDRSLVHPEHLRVIEPGPQPYMLEQEAQEAGPSVRIGYLLKTYWLLVIALMLVGGAAGFISVILSTPVYKTRLLLEVENPNGSLLRSSSIGGGAVTDEAIQTDIDTQVNILRSGSFIQRGAERMQSDTVPVIPAGNDIFSRLRQRLHAAKDPLDVAKTGLNIAAETFDARPVNRTRLIELTCDSSSPDVAAQFLNAMGAEFADDAVQSRMQTAQKTSEWLAGQIEDTKARVQESEEKLRDYVKASNNVFAGQDATLDDTKLARLKDELAKIQNQRIALQARYELTLHNPPETLGEILDDAVLRGYQTQLESLKRDRAALETIYTPKHEKVRKVDAQIATVQKAYENEIANVVKRVKNDYESSLRQEKLLSSAYSSQSQLVGGQAGQAAQYNALKREVDMQRQMYQNLLMEQNEAGMRTSVPVNPIRIVEPASPPAAPYKPRPVLNISFGTMLGIVLAGGLAFLKERSDRSIRYPGASRRLLNTPELGVIPNLLGAEGNRPEKNGWHISRTRQLTGTHEDPATALATWQSGPAFITESFRGTLASILRNHVSSEAQNVILITSPGPAEGKTTVVQNLGIALAETGRRVLLVDGDFRRPHLHRKFNLSNERGLIDLLYEECPISDYLPERLASFTGFPGLSVLPNRATSQNVSKALYSPRLRALLEALVKSYDMVLVDAAPILSVADARILARLADALILVLRCGVTDTEGAREAYRKIQEDGLTLLGTVLTDYDLSSDRKRQYYYDYGDPSRA